MIGLLWLGVTLVPGTVLASGKIGEIVLGAATSLAFLEGRESLNAVELAVHEINTRGGVLIGNKTHLFRVESVDLEGALPGVPVSRAVAALERLCAGHGTYS